MKKQTRKVLDSVLGILGILAILMLLYGIFKTFI